MLSQGKLCFAKITSSGWRSHPCGLKVGGALPLQTSLVDSKNLEGFDPSKFLELLQQLRMLFYAVHALCGEFAGGFKIFRAGFAAA